MASINRVQNNGGYNCNWLVRPPQELVCKKCHLVAREPHQHGNRGCGQLFCEGCVRKHKEQDNNCPCCDPPRPLNTFRDDRAAYSIRALKVKCDNVTNGCQWLGELGNHEGHTDMCDYALMDCPNDCIDNNQIARILRKDLQDHCDNTCPKRKYECPHCHQRGEHWKMTTTHLEDCPDMEIKCLNAGCEDKLLRRVLQEHHSVCHYEPVPCKYATVGCEEKPIRRNLLEHEQDDKAHLHLAMKTVLNQQAELAQIKTKLKGLDNQKHIFRMTEFDRHKNDDRIFFSPSIYTSRIGYKMRIEVHANGCGKGKHTHVTVAAHLMKGDNDDLLDWPFAGQVTFELLNQLENKNHHSRSVNFLPNKEYSQRVVEGERDVGCGAHEFIAHHDLYYRPNINCQYLKDNSLVFRISMNVTSNKSWLECTI